jgi:hypothetical protein
MVAATTPTMKPAAPSVTFGDLRFGQRTLRSSDAASIRYRFVGTGPASTRDIVPDTPRAELLSVSSAGKAMERALRRFASQIDAGHGRDNLSSVTLTPDVDALAAAHFRAFFEPARSAQATVPSDQLDGWRQGARSVRAISRAKEHTNGATNDGGDIVLAPETSRMLLAAVGAYAPSRGELAGTKVPALHAGISLMMRHEMEHSVTPSSGDVLEGLRGLEEGIAETLATARTTRAVAQHDLPSVRLWGVITDASARATDGWDAAPRGSLTEHDSKQQSNQVYVQRAALVRNLAQLAGADVDTRAGYAAARDLLQGHALARVPGVLADTIIARHELSRDIREPLRLAIRDITESASLDPIADLRTRFGIALSSPA